MSAEPIRFDPSARSCVIPTRFCGPPGSGNGGYVAERLCTLAGLRGTVEVTLRRPTPLATPLAVVPAGAGWALEGPDGAVLAEARALERPLTHEPPRLPRDLPLPTLARPEHPVPGCFGCGAQHPGGLRIQPAPVPGTRIVAARWTPPADLADADGRIHAGVVWAAIDCPGWFAVHGPSPLSLMLLGRITARVGTVWAGQPYLVVAEPLASDGRRHHAATALLDGNGRVVARSQQVWISPRPA